MGIELGTHCSQSQSRYQYSTESQEQQLFKCIYIQYTMSFVKTKNHTILKECNKESRHNNNLNLLGTHIKRYNEGIT